MAYTFNNTSGNWTSSTITTLAATTPIASVAAGDLIVVFFVSRGGTTTHDSMTDGTNTYTKIQDFDDNASSGRRVSMWYALPSSTQTNVTPQGTSSVANDRHGIQWLHYSGISAYQSSNYTAVTSPTTATDAVTTSATASAQPALVVALGWSRLNTTAPAAGTGFTDRGTATFIQTSLGVRLEDQQITATGSAAATFTAGTDTRHAAFIGIFTESGGGATAATKAAFYNMLRRNN